ncbi:MAG TPA: hypothetical protein VFX61_17240, partial [Micromonosporaceae bacterium]|nr:hypothetical protein [Micromonosporaceae bacterium]
MPDLDVRLARERADLRDAIEQPPLASLRERAAARVRRRRAIVAAMLLAVAATGALAVRPWNTGPPNPPPVADTPPTAPTYSAAGITINGLTAAQVLEIAGTIVDVEFVTPDIGYVLAKCAPADPCDAFLGRTNDGGITWSGNQLPFSTNGTDLDLLTFPDGQLLLPDSGYRSGDGGRTWERTIAADIPTPLPAEPGDLLRLGPYSQSSRCGGPVEIWHPGFLRGGSTLSQPDIKVCWLAPVPATDGTWWAGGTQDGTAALAATRDRGATWQTITLDAAGQEIRSVEVAFLGSHVYAVVLGPDRAILALLHSADGGQTFTRTRKGNAGAPQSLAGAMVPLLDGRL